MRRLALFISFFGCFATLSKAQVFIQANSNQFKSGDLLESLGNSKLFSLNGQDIVLKIEVDIYDSTYSQVGQYTTNFHTVTDSLSLTGILRNTIENSESPLAINGRVYANFRAIDDVGNVLGEFMYEYSEFVIQKQQKPDKATRNWPIQIHGTTSISYEYNSSNYIGSNYSNHLFIYSFNPSINLWGVPLKGNLRLAPGNINFKDLLYSNIQLDVNELDGLKRQLEESARKKAETELDRIKQEAIDEIESKRQELEASISRLENVLQDSLSKYSDTSGIVSGLLDSIPQFRKDSINYQDSIHLDSVQYNYQLYKDSVEEQIALLRNALDELQSTRDSLDKLKKGVLGLSDYQNQSRMSHILSDFKINRMAIGNVYPILPSLIENQSQIIGLDFAFSKGKYTHEITSGKLRGFDFGDKSIYMLRYSLGYEMEDKSIVKATAIYNTSINSRNNPAKCQNPIFDIQYRKPLMKEGKMNLQIEVATSSIKEFNNHSQNTADENVRNQALNLNRYDLPGYSGLAQLDGMISGFSYLVSFREISNGFSTVLNPYKLNGLRTYNVQLSKSLFKNLLKINGDLSYTDEKAISKIHREKLALTISPKRWPKLKFSYQNYTREYSSGNRQNLSIYNGSISQSFKLWSLAHNFQGNYTYQKNEMGRMGKMINQSIVINNQTKISKKLLLNFNFSRLLSENRHGEFQIKTIQNSISGACMYAIDEYANSGIRAGYIQGMTSKNYTLGISANGAYKSFRMAVNYDFNNVLSLMGNSPLVQPIHRIQSQITYAF